MWQFHWNNLILHFIIHNQISSISWDFKPKHYSSKANIRKYNVTWKSIPMQLQCVKPIRVNTTLRWLHNERGSVSNHRPRECLLSRLIRRRSRKYQSSASLAFVRGIHRRPVNSLHKGPATWKMFPFDNVIMNPPSQTGQQRPGTFLGWAQLMAQDAVWHWARPPIHVHVVHSSWSQVALSG